MNLSDRRWRSVYDAVTDLSRSRPEIRVALVVGSRARRRMPADRWSDMDVVLFVRDPERFLRSASWLGQIGTPAVTFLEPTAVGGAIERRVLFSDGVDVDFAVFPASSLTRLFESRDGAAVLRRGYLVVVDKDGRSPVLRRAASRRGASRPPGLGRKEFRDTTADFWYHAVWAAKKLRRGEVWVAKQACDGHLKTLLLRLLEWDAWSRSPGRADTWHSGRFLETWANREYLRRLRRCFARYDPGEVRRAIRATMDLFHDVEVGIAARLGFARSQTPELTARRLVRAIARS